MQPLKLTLGSDPELVIFDAKKGPVSALRILKNTKDNPIDLGESIRIYADNVLVEAAFDPVKPEGIVDRMGLVINKMRAYVKSLNAGDLDVLPQAATHYPLRELRNKIAWMAGCDANWDAYRDAINGKAKFTDGLRTGSFHIHIGNADWEKGEDDRLLSKASKIEAIKLLDLYVGLTSVLFDKDPTAGIRRKLYGRAGEFRPTPYGVEYRVLGNYALRTRKCTQLVFDLVALAMDHISNGTGDFALSLIPEKEVIRIINDNDKASALDAMLDLKLGPKMTQRILENDYQEQNGMVPSW